MSVNYGGPPVGGAAYGGNVPQMGRVNFGWISESWQLFIAQVGVWIVGTLVLSALPIILLVIFYGMMWSTMFPNGFPPSPPSPGTPFPPSGTNPMLVPGNMGKILSLEIGLGLLSVVYSAFFYGGLLRMAVQQVRGYPPTYRDIFAGGPLFGRMLGAMFLLGLGVYGLELVCAAPALILIGVHASQAAQIAAFVLAGIVIFALTFVIGGLLLPAFAQMADGEGVFTALRRSIQSTKGQWAAAAGFIFVLVLLIYASELPCGLGLLATVPMMFLITALAYRDLVGMPNILPPPMPGVYGSASSGVWPPPPDARPPTFGAPPSPPNPPPPAA